MLDSRDGIPLTVSRYRSRRNTQSAQKNQTSPSPSRSASLEQQTSPNAGLARSRSRYRRANLDPPPVQDALPTIVQQDIPSKAALQLDRVTAPQSQECLRYGFNRSAKDTSLSATKPTLGKEGNKPTLSQFSKSMQSMSPSGAEKQNSTSNSQVEMKVASSKRQSKDEDVYRTDGPPTSNQIRATKPDEIPNDLGIHETKLSTWFGLLRRRKDDSVRLQDKLSKAAPTPFGLNDGPATIKVGGGGVVPGTDAPISAVNAGDRHVLIECGKSSMVFPITPETTPVDLIKSAATVMSEPIDVRTAILKENFRTVGLQRYLRRYEHVRDVMNSWDHDRQNNLLLVHPEKTDLATKMYAADLALSQPPEGEWLLHYSQKPGRWDRRMIAVLPDGQITGTKSNSKSPSPENLCHLSDFDIYSPTQERLRKKIKPPKQCCYAIKSQQKTAMFESAQNFVHFFSHGDQAVAESFYVCVQKWRSWYLMNIMGEGKRNARQTARTSDVKQNKSHKAHGSQDSFNSHYQLGSFQPLLDLSVPLGQMSGMAVTPAISGFTSGDSSPPTARRNRPPSGTKIQGPVDITRRGIPRLAEDEPLANLPQILSKDTRQSSPPSSATPDNFPLNSLLGRSYSQRRHEIESRKDKDESPWVAGPNLLNGGRDAMPGIHNGTIEDARLVRCEIKYEGETAGTSASREQRQRTSHDLAQINVRAVEQTRPLVNLTSQFQETQHGHRGKAHRLGLPIIGPLVDNTTSFSDPAVIASSKDRRMKAAHGQPRTISTSRPQATTVTTRIPGGFDAFASDSLLSQSQTGWGGANRGRGHMDGAHATGPMLNVSEGSKFVHGSLLNHVETMQGREGPIVDREKRIERNEKVGEGF